jgi:hypothetical protein
MKVNSDLRDLLRALNAARARYLVVGGYAVMVHAEPRFTKDLDIWIEATPADAERVIAALTAFGAPLGELARDRFRVGLYSRRLDTVFGGEPVSVIGRDDLILSKSLAGRRIDRADLRLLRRKRP